VSRAGPRCARAAALLALVLGAACIEPPRPLVAKPGIVATGGPLVTSERGTTATFQVALATAPSAPVVVLVLSEDSSEGLLLAPGGAAPAAWTTLHFTAADWGTPQPVTVKGVDDAVKDGDVTYDIRLSVAGSDDPAYAGAPDTTIKVVNHDDDLPAILLSRTALVVSETGPRWDAFDVVLSTQPTGLVTLPVESGDPTEGLLDGGPEWIAPVDRIQLLFTPSNWSTPQRVTVTGRPDAVTDGDQAWTVTVGRATGAPEYAALPPRSVAVVTIDTDVTGLLVSPRTLLFSEREAAGLGVRLGTRPASPVVVPITSGDPSAAVLREPVYGGHVATLSLTFDATNWNIEKEVVVEGIPDSTVTGPRDVTFTVGPPTGDPLYAALPATTVPVTILDADTPGIDLYFPSWVNGTGVLQVSEAGGTNPFSVRLMARPLADVLVPVTSSDPTEALVSAGGAPPAPATTLTFTPADWFTYQPVEVSGVADAIVELGPPHPFTISCGPTRSASALYDGVAGPTLPGTNADATPIPGEGTPAAPVAVTGLLPYAGMVGKGSSWYRVTGFPDGALVGIRDTIDWLGFTAWDESLALRLCSPPAHTNLPSACAVRLPPGGSFLVEVAGGATQRGSVFTLDVVPFTFATGTPLPVSAYPGSSSTITLSGVPAGYARVALTVEISVADSRVQQFIVGFLTPPGGSATYQVFQNDSGGLGFDRTVFDESAALSILSGSPPYAGRFHPAVAFPHPRDANGTWTLQVYSAQPGKLVSWGIAAR
jgi:hypothetical protein